MAAEGLEKILSRIDIGKFHKVLFMAFGLMYVSYGMSLTLSTIMPTVLQEYWGLSSSELGLAGGIFNIGYSLGTLGAAWEDHFGRKLFLRVGIVSIFVGTAGAAGMPDFWSYTFFNFLIGLGVGLYEIAEISLLTEVNAIPYRAKFFVFLNIPYLAGSCIILGVAFALTPGLHPGHWRWLVAIPAFFAITPLILSFTFIPESPRFLIAKERFAEAEAVFEKISIYSNKGSLSEEER